MKELDRLRWRKYPNEKPNQLKLVLTRIHNDSTTNGFEYKVNRFKGNDMIIDQYGEEHLFNKNCKLEWRPL